MEIESTEKTDHIPGTAVSNTEENSGNNFATGVSVESNDESSPITRTVEQSEIARGNNVNEINKSESNSISGSTINVSATDATTNVFSKSTSQIIKFEEEKDSNSQEHGVTCWRKYAGVIFALICTLSYSFVAVVIKSLPNVHPLNQATWGQLVNTIITITITLILKAFNCPNVNILSGILEENANQERIINWWNLGKLIGAGFVIASGVIFRTTAFTYLTIADATALSYLSIILVLIAAHFILHEKCKIVQVVMAVVIICGAIVLARPPFLTGQEKFHIDQAIGIGLKILDSSCLAFTSIFVRKCRQFHAVGLALSFNIVGVLLSTTVAIPMKIFAIPTDVRDIGLLIVLGFCFCLAHNTYTLALQYERASLVNIIRCGSVPLVIVWQIMIFQLLPDLFTIIGSSLICTAVLITGVCKFIDELPKDSTIRKRLWFLLK